MFGAKFTRGKFCGYGLVVEHVLAKDETGVRFSYPAQKYNKVFFVKNQMKLPIIMVICAGESD